MIAVWLHSIALIIALNVQTMNTPLAGAWLFFFLSGCVYGYKPNNQKNPLWYACVAWLIVLGMDAFLFSPVPNGCATMWILSAMPIMALTLNRDYISRYLKAFLSIIMIYAIGLIFQMLAHFTYNTYNYYVDFRGSWAVAWPLVDPNNAAAVLNMGLIPCIYMALRDKRYFVLAAILILALYATASKTGAIIALLAFGALLYEKIVKNSTRLHFLIFVANCAGMLLFMGHSFISNIPDSVAQRILMWRDSIKLLTIYPFTGTGLGTFGFYYRQIRTEYDTGGWFAHNDLLQIFIENGIPSAIIFLYLISRVLATTGRCNFVSAVILLSLFLHSMMEFQFYLPCISILAGLALAYHLTCYQENKIMLKK